MLYFRNMMSDYFDHLIISFSGGVSTVKQDVKDHRARLLVKSALLKRKSKENINANSERFESDVEWIFMLCVNMLLLFLHCFPRVSCSLKSVWRVSQLKLKM